MLLIRWTGGCRHLFELAFFFSYGYVSQSGIFGLFGSFIFNFSEDTPDHFLQWLYQFAFLPAVHKGSLHILTSICYHLSFDDTHSSVLARDGGAWWAAVCGVAQSRTGLKWLSSSILTYVSLYLTVVWICVSLMISDDGQLFMYQLAS